MVAKVHRQVPDDNIVGFSEIQQIFKLCFWLKVLNATKSNNRSAMKNLSFEPFKLQFLKVTLNCNKTDPFLLTMGKDLVELIEKTAFNFLNTLRLHLNFFKLFVDLVLGHCHTFFYSIKRKAVEIDKIL
jgi:hypothetical protein